MIAVRNGDACPAPFENLLNVSASVIARGISSRSGTLEGEAAMAQLIGDPGAIVTTTAEKQVDKGLKGGALGLISSTVMGVASTAPAYSLASTLGFVVVAIGLQAPIVTVLAFVPMLLIAIAYQELNKADPDCGTTFTWATRAFNPNWGWAGGWAIVAADVLVMASLAQVAGQYIFLLFNAQGI